MPGSSGKTYDFTERRRSVAAMSSITFLLKSLAGTSWRPMFPKKTCALALKSRLACKIRINAAGATKKMTRRSRRAS